MKKALITDADGFIGSNLTELLLETVIKVRALVQYNSFNYWGWLEDIPSNPNLEIVIGAVVTLIFVKKLSREWISFFI